MMKNRMAESLRGEMSGSTGKMKCPAINLNWLLNASKDESDQVCTHISILSH